MTSEASDDLLLFNDSNIQLGRVQMSPATHHMSSKDLQQSDTDEFQQIQSTGSMEDTKNCLKSFMFPFMQAGPVGGRFRVLGMKEGPKRVQLHINCPLWIHKRLMEDTKNCLKRAMLSITALASWALIHYYFELSSSFSVFVAAKDDDIIEKCHISNINLFMINHS
jgi:hypothetical protein